ncbi:MAG TPA: ABC transporter permease [Chloroflexia bacterium]|nr:ABC transporter permease [Chloroflexia bacterium]
MREVDLDTLRKTREQVQKAQPVNREKSRLTYRSSLMLKRYGPAVLLLILLLAGWQLYTVVSGIRATVLPGPWRVLEALVNFWDVIYDNLLYTLYETVVGFGVALVAGFAFAMLLDSSSVLRRAVYPLLVASQTIPLVAIAPLLIIWFGYDIVPKILVVWLVCFFPIVVAGVDGFASTDPEITRLFKSMNATRWQIFWKLRLPSALPFLFSGIRIAITYSVAGAILGEYVGAEKGLGIFIQRSKNSFRNDLIFAAVLVTAVVSVLLFVLVSVIQHRVMPWYFKMREKKEEIQ